MAIAATAIAEVEQAGSDNNGGAFNPANSNMATDLAGTSANTASPVVSSASYNFVAGDVGHWVFIKSGTNWTPGWYKIASVASNQATLTAGVGTAFIAKHQGTNYCVTVASTVAGCATTASPTSGTWSIDYTQKTSAAFADTDLVLATSTTMTSAAHPFGVNMVGNHIQITAGTGFTTGVYEIVSVAATTATVDRSAGTGGSTGGTANVGGAYATPGFAATIAGNIYCNYNATAYTCGSSTGAGGKISTSAALVLIGYDTNRHTWNTDANRPQFNATANSMQTILMSGGSFPQMVRNIIGSANTHTSVIPFWTQTGSGFFDRCKAVGACSTGFLLEGGGNRGGIAFNCEDNGSTSAGFADNGSGRPMLIYGCTCSSVPNSGTGFSVQDGSFLNRCLAIGAASSTGTGYLIGVGAVATQCVAYGFTGTNGVGFTLNGGGGSVPAELANCVSYNNYINWDGTTGYRESLVLWNCAGGGAGNSDLNGSNLTLGQFPGYQTLTADPFTNAAGNDFSPNNTAGGGALLRQLGFPATFPGLSTTSNITIGAADPAAAAGGPVGGGNLRGNFGN